MGAAVRIQVEGTHSLQIAAVEVFRAEGRQHKDDELHHFYDLMHTINEHQTQRTLDQIPSPLQEQSFFSEDTMTSRRKKVVPTPQCGDKSAFFSRRDAIYFYASSPTDTCGIVTSGYDVSTFTSSGSEDQET